MNATESENPQTQGENAATTGEANEQADRREATNNLSYEGTRVPVYLVFVWLAFFIWGLVYLLAWVPESIREWFSGK